MAVKFRYLLLCITLIILASCSGYQKVLKSRNFEFKYEKGKEYYESGEYAKSSTIFNELLPIYRGTNKAQDIYFFLAKSYYGQKDNLLAIHYFRMLTSEFPRSEYAEESQFLIGYCHYLESPGVRLDQSITMKGIDALKLFINMYHGSSKVEEATRLIDELNEKIVHKSYLSSRLYYDLKDYRAAVISLSNSLEEYPHTKRREEMMFLLLKSKYLLGDNSVDDKKRERLNMALDEYFAFVDEFPNSKNRKEADWFFNNTKGMLNLSDEDLNIGN